MPPRCLVLYIRFFGKYFYHKYSRLEKFKDTCVTDPSLNVTEYPQSRALTEEALSASIMVVLGHPPPPIRGSQEATPRLSGKRLAKSSGQVCQEPSFKHLGSGQETEMPHYSDRAPQVSPSQADPGSKQATYPQPCQRETRCLHVRQGGVQSRLLHARLGAGGPVENLSQRKRKLRGAVRHAAPWPPAALAPIHSGFSGHRHVWR